MKLENQVVSLELAKRLKELGVKQESIAGFRLISITDADGGEIGEEWHLSTTGYEVMRQRSDEYAAFTVSELGEMLPWMVEANGQSYFIELAKNGPQFHGGKHHVCYVSGDDEQEALGEMTPSITEADARAKMLIYLLENKLIEV